MPIYLVKGPKGDRLVQAAQKNTAINHVIRDSITAEAVTADDVVAHIRNGLTVETAAPNLQEQSEATVNRSADVKAMDPAEAKVDQQP